MQVGQAVAGFAAVAALITIVPGLDTALVLRSALTRGRAVAWWTALGIAAGVVVWGAAAAVGIALLLTASEVAYDVVRWLGAAYLVYLGTRLVVSAARGTSGVAPDAASSVSAGRFRAWASGAGTNLLNPKVGVFYLATLPQFLVPGVPPLAMGVLLAGVHVVLGLVWSGLLIAVAGAAARWLRRPSFTRVVDGVTGGVLVGFGLHLVLDPT